MSVAIPRDFSPQLFSNSPLLDGVRMRNASFLLGCIWKKRKKKETFEILEGWTSVSPNSRSWSLFHRASVSHCFIRLFSCCCLDLPIADPGLSRPNTRADGANGTRGGGKSLDAELLLVVSKLYSVKCKRKLTGIDFPFVQSLVTSFFFL